MRKQKAQLQGISGALGLSRRAKELFDDICQEYQIDDRGGQEVLLSGLRSLDLAESCEAQIAQEGKTVRDRFGVPRLHPLVPMARDYRAQWQQALKGLHLAIGEDVKTGRPS